MLTWFPAWHIGANALKAGVLTDVVPLTVNRYLSTRTKQTGERDAYKSHKNLVNHYFFLHVARRSNTGTGSRRSVRA